MAEKYELRLCPNGVYYLYEDRFVNSDISFDKFNKESAKELVSILNKLFEENKQLKEELGSFEQISFTDLCNGSKTVLYMKKENVGDSE